MVDSESPQRREGEPHEVSGSLFDVIGTATLLFFFAGCLLLYLLLQSVLWGGRPGAGLWGLALAPAAGILLPIAFFIRSMGRSVREELWLFSLSPRQLVGVTLAILGTVPLAYALSAVNTWLVAPDPESERLLESLVPTDASSFAAGLLAVVLLAPLGEEVLFRVILLGTLGRHMRPVVAVLVAGLLFAMTHLAPWILLPLSVIGIVLGFLVLLTRTLTAAWVGHGLFNLIGYLELVLTGDVDTPGLVRLGLQPAALISAPVILGAGVWLLRLPSPAREDPTKGQWS